MNARRLHGSFATSRRDLLRVAAAAPIVAALGCGARRSPKSPPGLLVLLADDLSARDLPLYGNPYPRTPNIDRLAAEGTLFRRAYAAVGVCQPSRSSLYTGLYPTRHGALGFDPIRADVATWPELLRAAGVATAMIGKLHVDPESKFPFDLLLKMHAMPSRRTPEDFARPLGEFVRNAAGRPFAAVMAFIDPHRPYGEEGPARPTRDPASIQVPRTLWDTPQTRRELAQYYDCIDRLDRSVGAALAAIEAAGRADSTLVVFASDNGAGFPFAKSTLYEAGVHMPLVVRGPGVERGAVRSEFVNLVDLLPTALEHLGAPAVAGLDGRSLAPLLRGESPHWRDSMVTMQTGLAEGDDYPIRALHGPRFAYIRNLRSEAAFTNNVTRLSDTWSSGRDLAQRDANVERRMTSFLWRPSEELYDLESDPDELQNLAADAAHAETLAAMRAGLRKWMVENGDPGLADWPE